ncbi:uncharacterized protein LOC121411989 [Lytechinus variegatus]|uniref:uncharacterized protein LOC121411989 n=1 Tax=Lytechinus variegatus TaxID=7654 RepID=UPI001BB1BAAD|nr:uncharacterized protein LOC121411989 [Lytechinus variegatus]
MSVEPKEMDVAPATDKQQDQDPKSNMVSNVALKLPPFWPSDPALWFAQVEAQFLTRNIVRQDTMFAYVISSLQQDYAQEVRDFIISPPATERYNKLKAELIKRTGESEQKRLHQLLIAEELGDRKPSQLLRKMRQLLGENTLEESIMRQLFLQRLPDNVRLILASSSETTPIEQLSEMADKIFEVAAPSPNIHAIKPSVAQLAPRAPVNSEVAILQATVNQLAERVEALCHLTEDRGRQRDRQPAKRPRSKSRARSSTRAGSECWYHWKYGEKAKRCTPPCSHSESNINNNQGN